MFKTEEVTNKERPSKLSDVDTLASLGWWRGTGPLLGYRGPRETNSRDSLPHVSTPATDTGSGSAAGSLSHRRQPALCIHGPCIHGVDQLQIESSLKVVSIPDRLFSWSLFSKGHRVIITYKAFTLSCILKVILT